MLLIDAKSFRSNPKLHLTMLECGEELEIMTELPYRGNRLPGFYPLSDQGLSADAA